MPTLATAGSAPSRRTAATTPRRPPRPARAAARALRMLTLAIAGAALGLGARAAATQAPLALLPGIAFAWTDPVGEATLGFALRSAPASDDPLVRVESGARALEVTGFHLSEGGRRLEVLVRATAFGVIELPSLRLTSRYGATQRLDAGAAEVLALPRSGGPLVLERWLADDAVGLYAAFALRNAGALPLAVRTLRYAPEPMSRGLVLTGQGSPDAFDGWAAAVLDAMTPAFAAFLEGHGRSSGPAARAIVPASLAFPLSGALQGSRWSAPANLAVRLGPGSSLFVALTPAAFRHYVGDLSITASPVVGYVEGEDGACCRLQGVPATIHHSPAAIAP